MPSLHLLLIVFTLMLSAVHAVSPAAAAPAVETFVLAVGGQSTPTFPNPPQFACISGIAPAPVLSFFGAQGPFLPLEGLAPCNVAGDFNTTTSPTGPLSDSRWLNIPFNNFDHNTFAGATFATADYGKVGAQATGTFTGPYSNLIVEGTEAYGKFRETFTITSPSVATGTAGTVRLKFTVDGSLSVSGPPPFSSTSDVEVNYQTDAGPIFTLLRAQVTRADLQPFISVPTAFGSQVGPGVFGGFTLAAGSVSGSREFGTFL